MWMFYAALAALFSALTAILTKIGLQGINSHLATAIRTSGVLIITWLMVWAAGVRGAALHVTRGQAVFLALSALATGGAWLCYNRALQDGPATRVASIDKMSVVVVAILSMLIFRENMSWTAALGVLMIAGGTIMLVFT